MFRHFARRNRCLTGMLFVLPLLFGTTIQVTHSHLPGESHADCSLCVTAHTAVEIIILPSGFVVPVSQVERFASPPPSLVTRLVLAHPLWNLASPAALLSAA